MQRRFWFVIFILGICFFYFSHNQKDIPDLVRHSINKISRPKKVLDDAKEKYYVTLAVKIKSLQRQLASRHIDTVTKFNLAREALESNDGHLKSIALEILQDCPPNLEALNLLITKVLNFHDAKLILPLLTLFKKYEDDFGSIITDAIMATFQTGSFFVQESLLKYMHLYLNRKNSDILIELADQGSPDFRKKILQNINNFKMFNQYSIK